MLKNVFEAEQCCWQWQFNSLHFSSV